MKILCVSDVVAPLVYSTKIKERFSDIELVIGAGDLPMEYLDYISSSLNKPIVFVFGNHNLKRLVEFRRSPPVEDWSQREVAIKQSFGATYIDNRIVMVKGVLIAGLGGSKRYNDGENQFTELEMIGKAFRLLPRMLWNRLRHGRFIDILVAHAAPYGINDKDDPCHVGFKTFLWFMRWFSPNLLIHGHIHLYNNNENRETRYFRTKIVNVYDHQVIQIKEGAAT